MPGSHRRPCRPTRPLLGLVAVALVPALAGCSTGRDAAVSDVVERFAAARDANDGAALCELLATGTRTELAESTGQPCAKAILDVPPPGSRTSVEVWGSEALVRASGDTLFLSRYAGGWRIVAAGCTASGDGPYDCSVKGG